MSENTLTLHVSIGGVGQQNRYLVVFFREMIPIKVNAIISSYLFGNLIELRDRSPVNKSKSHRNDGGDVGLRPVHTDGYADRFSRLANLSQSLHMRGCRAQEQN